MSAVFIGVRAYYFVPIGDDLLYHYILDDNVLWSNHITTEIGGFWDAVHSQSNQYFVSNGRALVHILVQMFAGPWGNPAFAIFIGCVYFAVLYLLLRYTLPEAKRKNPLFWLLATVCYLYVFGSGILWIRFAAAINYLFPMSLVLLYLIVFNRLGREKVISKCIFPVLILFGFVTGWSHEVYCIPLSGATFVYAILNFRKLSLSQWVMVISLWIGSLILIFAPGNFVRLGTSQPPLQTMFTGIKYLFATKMVWLLLCGLVVLRVASKKAFKNFVKDYKFDFFLLLFSIAFGLMANSGQWSFTGVAFFSCIIFFRLVGCLPLRNNWWNVILCVLIFSAISIHQIVIIRTMKEICIIEKGFINEYRFSEDKIITAPKITIPEMANGYIYNWFKSTETCEEIVKCLDLSYFEGQKHKIFLRKTDYDTYFSGKDQREFNSLTTIQPKDHIRGEEYLWLPRNSVNINDTLNVKYKPFQQNVLYLRALMWLKSQFIAKNPSRIEEKSIVVTDSIYLPGEGLWDGIKIGPRSISSFEVHRMKNN